MPLSYKHVEHSQGRTVLGRQLCPPQMVISLLLYHIQWALMNGTLLQLTLSDLQDKNDCPPWTDEETNVKEVKPGQRSRESEFKCSFSRFKFQITNETESASGLPETSSVVLCIIVGRCAFLLGYLEHCNHYSFGNSSQLKICWVNKKYSFLAKLGS